VGGDRAGGVFAQRQPQPGLVRVECGEDCRGRLGGVAGLLAVGAGQRGADRADDVGVRGKDRGLEQRAAGETRPERSWLDDQDLDSERGDPGREGR
jgi:hypothetical protein